MPTRPPAPRPPLARLGALVVALVASVVTLAGCGDTLFDRINYAPANGFCWIVVIVLDLIALYEVVTDGSRDTGNKVLWSLFIILFPLLGCIIYYFFGRRA
jgi:hypothetical protein